MPNTQTPGGPQAIHRFGRSWDRLRNAYGGTREPEDFAYYATRAADAAHSCSAGAMFRALSEYLNLSTTQQNIWQEARRRDIVEAAREFDGKVLAEIRRELEQNCGCRWLWR